MAGPLPLSLAIVDDDDDVRSALVRLLRAMGHEVRAYTSAEEFEAETTTVDCAIIDVRLPGLSGFDLGERLRRRRPPTPVVLMTGDGNRLARDIPDAIEAPLVTKPFDDVTLAAAIADAISTAGSFDGRHAS